MDFRFTSIPVSALHLILSYIPRRELAPEWIAHGIAYPQPFPPRLVQRWYEYQDYRIPRAIGQAYTSPFPYAAVFEVHRPKPKFDGRFIESPAIPYIRLVCYGHEFEDWRSDWRPVIVVPSGQLLPGDPTEPYLVSKVTFAPAPVDPVEFALLFDAWHSKEPFTGNYAPTDHWKSTVWDVFQVNHDDPSYRDDWLCITNRDLEPLRWIFDPFILPTIQNRALQLKRYLPLLPSLSYHDKVHTYHRQFKALGSVLGRLPPSPPPPPPDL